jgi:hypothetical protein
MGNTKEPPTQESDDAIELAFLGPLPGRKSHRDQIARQQRPMASESTQGRRRWGPTFDHRGHKLLQSGTCGAETDRSAAARPDSDRSGVLEAVELLRKRVKIALWAVEMPGKHYGRRNRQIRRLLIVSGGHATTRMLLAACFPDGPKDGRRFTLSERWRMQRAARRWARSVVYGRWEALPSLMVLLEPAEK